MNIEDLNKEYDKLQIRYGAKELNSIYNGGCTKNPDIFFIFMNPTGRNIASLASWKGIRSPWIGTKNIWKLFFALKLLDKKLYEEIQGKKSIEWNEDFASKVYENVKLNKYFISNLGKCTQIDARPLPDSVYEKYLDLLYKEIETIKPQKIIVFGNQVSSIFLGQKINVSKFRKLCFKKVIGNIEYDIYSTYYPIGNGMRNIDKTIEDLKEILKITS